MPSAAAVARVTLQVTKREVMEAADDDLLEAAGIVVSAAMWHRKGIRVNTKAVYTQQKFNLLREEGEGYAKLLAALNRFGAAALAPASVPGLVSLFPRCLRAESCPKMSS